MVRSQTIPRSHLYAYLDIDQGPDRGHDDQTKTKDLEKTSSWNFAISLSVQPIDPMSWIHLACPIP
eukprot:scaffold106717_cov31-Tisochrysis_lutea.AAC.1